LPVAFCTLALVAVGLTGCDRPEQIRVYTVTKPPPLDPKAYGNSSSPAGDVDEIVPNREFAQGAPAAGSAASGPTEMLGIIAPRGKTTWFFKLTGLPDAVDQVKDGFARFARSLKFGNDGPQWNLPEGWQAEPGTQMRFATIRIASAAGPLEMSVIPLPTGAGAFESQLLANVNRWRDQVGLGPLTAAQLAASKEIIKSELDGEPVWFTDFVGESKGNSMGGPSAGKAPPREAPTAKAARKLPFDCQIPEGWKAGQAGQFQSAVFDIVDGDQKASVTVSAAGGDLAANINRWRGQVGLADASAAEIIQQAQRIQIDGHEATHVELIGPGSAARGKTILGVIVEAQGKQWFIKLTGDTELAAAEKPRFEEFLKSIKFR
jgi:hypothetical protein